MADSRNRTLIEFSSGSFDVLRRDLLRYKRRGRRLKELATLGLAAEAAGLSVTEADGRLVLADLTGQTQMPPPAPGTLPSPAPVQSAPEPRPEARPEIAGIMLQFMDHDDEQEASVAS